MTTAIELTLPRFHPAQQQVNAEAKRFNALECGRRWGKTTFGLNKLVEPALAGKPVAWFAPTYKTLAEVWKDADRLLKPVVQTRNKVEQQFRLITGGVVDFWSLDNPDSGRGRKYARIIVDEAGIVRELEEAWMAAIRPTLTDLRGDAWFLFTPKGRNFAHRLYQRGEQGQDNWASWRMPTVTNPYISKEEVEDAKRELPKHIFEQEYLGIPAEDGGNPFGIPAIAACVAPLSTATPVAFGVDLAKSQDWTVVCGIDADGCVCVLERWQGDWGKTRDRVLSMVNGWPTLIDSTGVGDPIVEDLQRVRNNIEGFKFTSTSKQQIMEGLASAIQQQTVRMPDGWLRAELESFEYEYTRTGVKYAAPQGLHDDGVCALALAVHHKQMARPFAYSMAGFDDDDHNIDEDW